VKRRLFNLLALASLLLCVAAVVMWGRSYFYGDTIGGEDSPAVGWRRGGGLYSSIGGIEADWWLRRVTSSDPAGFSAFSHRVATNQRGLQDAYLNSLHGVRLLGFFYVHQVQTTTMGDDGKPIPHFQDTHVLLIPYWAVCAALIVAPVMYYRRSRAERRRKVQGVCAHCGYDLRATPDRCPECGTVPPVGNSKP
jgi:hypothetical protein